MAGVRKLPLSQADRGRLATDTPGDPEPPGGGWGRGRLPPREPRQKREPLVSMMSQVSKEDASGAGLTAILNNLAVLIPTLLGISPERWAEMTRGRDAAP